MIGKFFLITNFGIRRTVSDQNEEKDTRMKTQVLLFDG